MTLKTFRTNKWEGGTYIGLPWFEGMVLGHNLTPPKRPGWLYINIRWNWSVGAWSGGVVGISSVETQPMMAQGKKLLKNTQKYYSNKATLQVLELYLEQYWLQGEIISPMRPTGKICCKKFVLGNISDIIIVNFY